MRKVLFHLLLSVALIFQGMGVACASGMKMGNMGSMASGDTGMHADAGSDGCKGCASCPDQQPQHGSDCAPGCAAAFVVLSLRVAVPPGVVATVTAPAFKPALVDFLQPPPIPPPIA